jgi:FkbM family methyltransferase
MNYPLKLKQIKRKTESTLGIRVFPNSSLPRGTDMYIDLQDVAKLEDVKTVFDIGANVGQSALEYSERFRSANIYSFEPVSTTYDRLVCAAKHLERVHCFRLAMGSRPGESIINVHPDTLGSSMAHETGGAAEKIVVTTPSEFAREHKIETIDFMKVDTEGFDLEVLAGAAPLLREQRIRFVMAECEPLPVTGYFVSFCALADFFKSYPYKLFGIYRQQPDWDGRRSLLYFNVLFICDELGG